MSTLAETGTATVSFITNDSISINAGSGFAQWEYPVGTVVAQFSGTREFGPYSNSSGKLTAVQGSLYYEFKDYSTAANTPADTPLKVKLRRVLKQANASNLFINPAPTTPVTVTSTAAASTLSVSYDMPGLVGGTTKLWNVLGGLEKVYGGSNYQVASTSAGADGVGSGTPKQDITTAAAIEFVTASAQVTLKTFCGAVQQFRVAVNGVYQTAVQSTPATGTIYITIGVGATPLPSGSNRIRVEFEQTSGNIPILFNNLYVNTGHFVYAPTDEETVEALFIGDSYFSTGTSGQYEHNGIPAVVAKRLGWNYTAAALGSTGYVSAGTSSPFGSIGRLADYAVKTFDTVVIFGSVNESAGAVGSAGYQLLRDAALACWRAIRVRQPLAKIYVFGCPTCINFTGPSATQNEVCLADAFAQWGDSNATLIKMSDGTDTWIPVSSTGTFISGDNVHLNQMGVYYTADRMVQAIKADLR